MPRVLPLAVFEASDRVDHRPAVACRGVLAGSEVQVQHQLPCRRRFHGQVEGGLLSGEVAEGVGPPLVECHGATSGFEVRRPRADGVVQVECFGYAELRGEGDGASKATLWWSMVTWRGSCSNGASGAA